MSALGYCVVLHVSCVKYLVTEDHIISVKIAGERSLRDTKMVR